jgi:exonuclease III
MALLVSALCNNSGVTQKERERADSTDDSGSSDRGRNRRRRRKGFLWWKRDENEEEAGILSHEEGTSMPRSNDC